MDKAHDGPILGMVHLGKRGDCSHLVTKQPESQTGSQADSGRQTVTELVSACSGRQLSRGGKILGDTVTKME